MLVRLLLEGVWGLGRTVAAEALHATVVGSGDALGSREGGGTGCGGEDSGSGSRHGGRCEEERGSSGEEELHFCYWEGNSGLVQ